MDGKARSEEPLGTHIHSRQESPRSRLHHTTGSPTLIASKLSPWLGSSGSIAVRTRSMQTLASEVELSVLLGSPRTAASKHSFDPLATFLPWAPVWFIGTCSTGAFRGFPGIAGIGATCWLATTGGCAMSFAAAALASNQEQSPAAEPVVAPVVVAPELLEAPEPAVALAAPELVPEVAAAAELVAPSAEPTALAAEPEREETREATLDELEAVPESELGPASTVILMA
ncbi:hypothetical protein PI124_g2472 [Phytophthora idaei]|nr:hypothetical protein PI125_g2102 [Phytophthora idaei]KAG3171444.1 hypothetical protein PI126_g1910 [Phytophthora idaei]KAG3252941.1 hypothetical protein PI124_g2472 [Phytophthora idaei]